MCYDRCLKLRSLGAFLAILVVVGLSGCGAAETAAVFSSGGSADNSLEGSVISDDGQDFRLSTDGATLSKVEISSGAEIGFDRGLTETSQVAAVSRIETASGNTAEYDASRQTLTVVAEFPFVGRQEIEIQAGDLLGELFGGTNQRASNQLDDDCGAIVNSVNNFCTAYLDNADAALQEVIDFALVEAAKLGIPEIAFGTIEGTIREFFDVLQDFCEAWDELITGTDTTDPVDPCNFDG